MKRTLVVSIILCRLVSAAAPPKAEKGEKEAKFEKAKPAFLESKITARTLDDFSGVVINSPRSIATSPENPFFGSSGQTRLQINLTCYGSNLRSIPNPLDGCGTVHVDVKLAGAKEPITINIPSQLISAKSGAIESCPPSTEPLVVSSSSSELTAPPVMDSRTKLVSVDTKRGTSSFVVIKKDGSFSGLSSPVKVEYVKLRQTLSKGDNGDKAGKGINYGWGKQGYAQSGVLTAKPKYQINADGSLIAIEAQLQGEVGHCGGMVSPLMVFFDEKRPAFSGKSYFPLYPHGETYWVEEKAPGYFLALDKNSNGKIDQAEELFGNVAENNGFRALTRHDANRDGQITAADPTFSKLLLWNDRNGDGVSQKGELRRLTQMGIQSLDLNYRSDVVTDFGRRARIHEVSHFTFTDARGNARRGELVDVWFGQPVVLFGNLGDRIAD